ncbi:MAG: hypothetical protein M1826_002605 [Phylliscum demangeonii]|nr:MAG: hypothetical protein M1826_002605 [Phylliscum demangeonii]
MQLLQLSLVLACLARLGLSWPQASDAGLQQVERTRAAGNFDGMRQGIGMHGIERSQIKLQKRADEDPMRYEGPLATMLKETLKLLYVTRGQALPSDCVLDCLTRHAVDVATADQVPAGFDAFRGALQAWEAGCKRLCGEDDYGPIPAASPENPTGKQTPAKAKALGDPNFNFRLLPAALHPPRVAKAAKAATHRLGAWAGGWQRSAPGWEKSAGRLVRDAEMKLGIP